MTRALQLVVAFAALALVANAAITLSSSSLTSATFNALPGTVFDASVATNADYTVWSTLVDAIYGPGADNTTAYVYGRKITSTLISTVVSRKLNATILSNGTAAANGAATIGTDASATLTTAIKAYSDMAVGLGTMAFAYVAEDTNTCQQLYVTIYTGGSGSATATKQVTSNTCAATCVQTTTDGVIYGITPNSIFYDNSTYYVTYTTITYTLPKTDTTNCATGTGTAVTTTVAGVVLTYATKVQGVAATSTAGTTWSTQPSLATTAIFTPSCGPLNGSNSSVFYCVWKDGNGDTANTKYSSINAADGSTGSASGTVATDSTTGTTNIVKMIYTFGGFISGQYQQGFIVNNRTATSTDSGTTYTYANTLQIYNLTTGATATAGGVAVSGYSNTIQGGAYSGAGITFGQGYGLLTRYTSAATNPTYTYEIAAYLSNSTINGTKATVGSTDVVAAGNSFVDANGALWFGAYNLDTGASPDAVATGTLGKLIAQIYSSGNVLASFFALLSVMIAAVFAF